MLQVVNGVRLFCDGMFPAYIRQLTLRRDRLGGGREYRIRPASYSTVWSCSFAPQVQLPVCVEIARRPQCAQSQHRLRACQPPTCPRPVHSVLDHVSACPFHHPGRDRKSVLQCLLLVHHARQCPVRPGTCRLWCLACAPPRRSSPGVARPTWRPGRHITSRATRQQCQLRFPT